MPSSFKISKPHAHLERNGFDLSNTEIFSAKAGQLLPIKCIPVVPGDDFKINVKSLIRTMPLNSAAFVNMQARFDFFFVSYQSLWHNWDNFIAQRDDRTSTAVKGYNYVPTFSMDRLAILSKTIYDNAQTNQQPFHFDLQGCLISDDMVRLCDLLGYASSSAPVYAPGRWLDERGHQFLQLFPILGYNKIYFDYYSNPFYESVDPTLFNVDDLDCSTLNGSHIDVTTNPSASNRIQNMFQLRYAPWMKDYFSSSLPNQQFGSVSVVTTPVNFAQSLSGSVSCDFVSKDDLKVLTNSSGQVGVFDGSTSSSLNTVINMGSVLGRGSFDMLSLRMAEQLQRWKESTMRAGYRTKDQYEAHFGVTPKDYRAEHVQFLGSSSCTIGIDEVLTTANTNDVDRSTTGDIYGKGIGACSGQDIRFNSSEWGMIYCIMSILPTTYYNGSCMLSRQNTFAEPFDFYTPEFAKIGLDAIYSFELLNQSDQSINNRVFGYSNRYASYQTSVDKVHGILSSDGSLSYWTAPRFIDVNTSGMSVTPRFLHVSPSSLDNLFTVKADSTQETDQFIFETNFNIFAVRPMPKLSLPNII